MGPPSFSEEEPFWPELVDYCLRGLTVYACSVLGGWAGCTDCLPQELFAESYTEGLLVTLVESSSRPSVSRLFFFAFFLFFLPSYGFMM